MALTRETVIDKIEILEGGHIHVRRATYVLDSGTRIGFPEYHRVAYAPGADLAREDERVRAHARIAWQ